MEITDILGRELLIFDGAMGSMLQRLGMKPGGIPEEMSVVSPRAVESVHSAYLAAGCDCILSNTFGANRIKLRSSPYGTDDTAAAAMVCAKNAVAAAGGKRRFIALDIGPTGRLLEPFGDLPFEDAYSAFAELAAAGEMHGADLAVIETMTDLYEMKAAVLAVKENTSLPVFASLYLDASGRTLTGGDAECAVALLEGLSVDAIGVNCGFGPDKMSGFLRELSEYASTPLFIMPNAGMPRVVNGETVYDVTPEDFAALTAQAVQYGACALGGCCGTTPEHIRLLARECEGRLPCPPSKKDFTVISSYSEACRIGEKPVIIGERINPTGKRLFKEALRRGDIDYIVSQGLEQRDDGAQILDVNVGLPELDETAMMTGAVRALQEVISLPLQIDTASPEAMEAALRVYNGKPLINSVSGKQSVMDAVFPLAKKYGGVIVALTLDDDGIPESAEGRLEVARRILSAAESCGIEKKNLIFDALTMTVSTDAQAARTTIDAMSLIREKLGVRTVLGVSNVSFGLPCRETINSVFFAQALKRGLDAAIINPSSKMMMDVYYAHNVLLGLDPQCGEYLKRFAAQAPEAGGFDALSLAVINGMGDKAYQAARELLGELRPQELVESRLIPALNEVGRGFESKRLFLPQLLKSAQAAQSAFGAVREKLENEGARPGGKGSIVLATVKGDVHDIGKNILAVLLRNYGFDVTDLGRDVEASAVCEAARATGAALVGLSALMTTTVPAMEQTIHLLRDELPQVKIMVGGAVLTREYALKIGADFYGADAMSGVRYAEELFGN